MGTARTAIGLLAVLAATAFACATVHAEELTLYSTREANLVEPVIAAFTAASGTKVRTVFVEDSLVKRLTAEGDTSSADVLLTIGLDKTILLAARGLTQAIASPGLEQAVPANLRGGNGQWIALAIRPRVVFARKDSPLAAITYEELADPKWRGKVCMRPAAHQNNVALIAAYLAHHGTDATETWLGGLKRNLAHKPAGKDNDVVREIAEGRCDIGIGNTVALAQLRDGRDGTDWRAWADAVKAVPTIFEGGGSHVNLTGAAIARHAPHPAAARAFLEFLATPEAQTIFSTAELQYPVLATARRAPIVEGIGSFAADALSIDEIAAHQAAATALIRKAGFDE
ncbi:extracellular solute-binding protein [Bradyrhizobium sp. CCBAU 53421]|uniref:extracellular solute-binding protein n=1 Tax=Bradyrhizobium sp. CCBAU 53421 TaxID=1325120 RepID=UPI00188AF4D6|nr:extracellular solute-binding protein [Bradyrhizobium sp. CCBAU 53421]QOZ36097.1 iron ABC transporter substrate-binding protein [Bradyrhizobium sp. CCBAU 53421]